MKKMLTGDKMLKKTIIFPIILMMMIILTGCNSTAYELVDYNNNSVKGVENLERELVILYDEYAGLTLVDNLGLKVYEEILDERLIPKSQEILDYVQAIEVSDKEIQELHQVFIESLETRHHAFENELEAVREYFDTGGEEKFSETPVYLEKSNEQKQEYDETLAQLIDKYDIEVTKGN